DSGSIVSQPLKINCRCCLKNFNKMKKLLFSAIAMIAFSVDSSAQTGILIIDVSDSLDCLNKADKHLKSQEGWSLMDPNVASAIKNAYYAGCMEGKKSNKEADATINKKVISQNP